MTTKNKSSFREKVLRFIAENKLFSKNDKLLLAFSGGIDSTTLAYFLKQEGFSFALAHVNYSLRPEADADEEFCRNFAKKLEVPFFSKKVLTRSIVAGTRKSVQEIAREIRYDFFKELLQKHSYKYILTAHHKDDDLETAFFSLAKSKHYNILQGIPVKNKEIRRPFLCVFKEEIRRFAEEEKIPFVFDSSNSEAKYQRNFLRLKIFPELEQLNPSFREHLAERKSFYEKQLRVLRKYLKERFSENLLRENRETRILLPSSEQETEAWELFVGLFLQEQFGFSTRETKQILMLSRSEPGKRKYVRNFIVYKGKNVIILSEVISYENIHFEYKVMEGIPKDYKRSRTDRIYFDAEKVQGTLRFTPWEPGDKYVPLGMKGNKLVSDILNELGVLQKEGYPVLRDAKGIVYVPNYRIAERIKIDAKTKKTGILIWQL